MKGYEILSVEKRADLGRTHATSLHVQCNKRLEG